MDNYVNIYILFKFKNDYSGALSIAKVNFIDAIENINKLFKPELQIYFNNQDIRLHLSDWVMQAFKDEAIGFNSPYPSQGLPYKNQKVLFTEYHSIKFIRDTPWPCYGFYPRYPVYISLSKKVIDISGLAVNWHFCTKRIKKKFSIQSPVQISRIPFQKIEEMYYFFKGLELVNLEDSFIRDPWENFVYKFIEK